MNIGKWLRGSAKQLKDSGISTARLDALVLLSDALNKDKSFILAHPEDKLTSKQVDKLASKIKRRARHEPLAYIRGKSEFYGREFIVTPDTLEPRPETETMIELLLKLVESKKLKVESIIDVGTGSGCLAITSKLLLPKVKVHATDISKKCIDVAKLNAKNLGADIKFHHANLLSPFKQPHRLDGRPNYEVVLANLPYVPDDMTINQAAMFEPKHAIFGGQDGLDYYRQLFKQTKKFPNILTIMTESLPNQHKALAKIAKVNGFELQTTNDFIQVFTRVKPLK